MGDGRFISFNDELRPGGSLYGLRDLVAANDDLELCYRGNSGDKIVIYYKNHSMFDIVNLKRSQNQYKLTVSFNHARYEEDWQKKLENLYSNYNFRKSRKGNFGDKDDKGHLLCYFNSCEKIKFDELYKIIRPIMDNYFEPTKNKVIDYFKEEHALVTKKKHSEKQWQQRIFSGNTNCDNGYFIYDMEFARPHKSKVEADNDINNNEPDMLAIKYENHKPVKLAFIEVKSTNSACNNPKSGACVHIRKTAGALDEFFKTGKDEFIKVRKDDAEKIINGYASIKLHGLNQKPDLDFDNIDVEMLMVFTDEAVSWVKTEKNIDEMKNAALGYQQKLVFATVDESGKILSL